MDTQNPSNNRDHDLLIELKTEFTIFTRQYTLDMKNLSEGNTKQLAQQELMIKNHDKRLDEIDRIITVVKPEETTKDYLQFKQEIKNLILQAATAANIYRLVSGFVGALVMFILTQIPNILRSWGVLP